MMFVELLFIAGAIATGVCFARGHRKAGVIGALSALAMIGFYIGSAWVHPLYSGAAVLGLVYAGGMVIFLATRPRVDASPAAPSSGGERLKRGIIGGLIGITPGALVIAVPLLLFEMGAISADASQIGFLGILLAPVGLIAGVLVGVLIPSSRPSDGDRILSPPPVDGQGNQSVGQR